MKKDKYNKLPVKVIGLVFFLAFIIQACNQKTEPGDLSVSVDEDFKSLFYADSGGITGADGIFSVPLDDGSSVFFLGDCFLGEVENGARDINTTMLRNAFVVINEDQTQIKAIYKGTYNNPETLMTPPKDDGDTTYRWYWPGHGFTKNDTLYVFALNLYNEPTAVVSSDKSAEEQDEADKLSETMFAFRIGHIDLLSFSLPDFRHIETKKADFNYSENQIDFGNCVLVDGDYVYIFGTKNFPGIAKVHVARVPYQNKFFYTNWEYSTGTGWDKDIRKSKPIEVDIGVSEQFSIFKHKDKYILLTQERAGTDIFTYVSEYPNKGFKNKQNIYHTPDQELDSTHNIHAYNALAHVQYIENDELLVSYCVNSIRVKDVFENVEAYRANFIRVPMALILNGETNE